MTTNLENPSLQYKKLLEMFKKPEESINSEHFYINQVDTINKNVVQTAQSDKEMLGCPAICSGCKMVMEKALSFASKKLGADNLMMGYAKYQGLQNWVEQVPKQMDFLQKELKKQGTQIKSPFYEVLEYPFDINLLLSSLGVSFKNHKSEMKCAVGGLNPKTLDKEKLLNFLTTKNNSVTTPQEIELIKELPESKISSYQELIPDIKTLKCDSNFTKGIFNEQ